ncbi:MAG: acyl dehydratase [Chloroflexota bacterium]
MTTRARGTTRTSQPKAKIPHQICWEDVKEGDAIPPVDFNLTVQRMVMSAGSNRDFATIHHNPTMGKAAGSPDMFLNNVSCLQLWERVISDWIGIHGRVKKVSFRIMHFHAAGDVVHVAGKVAKKWQENGLNLLELEMQSDTPRMPGMTGSVVVALPSKANPTATPHWNAQGVAV